MTEFETKLTTSNGRDWVRLIEVFKKGLLTTEDVQWAQLTGKLEVAKIGQPGVFGGGDEFSCFDWETVKPMLEARLLLKTEIPDPIECYIPIDGLPKPNRDEVIRQIYPEAKAVYDAVKKEMTGKDKKKTMPKEDIQQKAIKCLQNHKFRHVTQDDLKLNMFDSLSKQERVPAKITMVVLERKGYEIKGLGQDDIKQIAKQK